MDALGDLVARERRSEASALVAPRENRRYDYHRFCTTAWKTGNFWRRRGVHARDEGARTGSSDERSESDGVHEGATVAVADDAEPEAVFSLFGAALLGAKTRFGLPDPSAVVEPNARVVVAPSDDIGDYEVPPGSQRVGYGGPPDDPAIAHFERDVWSENPSFPETPIDPEAGALVVAGADHRDGGSRGVRALYHPQLREAAQEVADDWGLEPGDEVAVRASLADPGTVVAGVVAPLIAGAAVLFPDEDSVGDFAVVDGDAPESAVRRPADVRFP
jgi:hypothetical protein